MNREEAMQAFDGIMLGDSGFERGRMRVMEEREK